MIRRGIVQDVTGQPISDARVVSLYAPDWPGDTAAYRFVSVKTDETGAFSHPFLSAALWEVLVIAPSHAPAWATLPAEGVSAISLGSGAVLQGRLLRADNQRPLNNVRIVVVAQDEAAEAYTVRTNGQGFFSVRHLRPTVYTVRLDSNRYVAESNVTVQDPDRLVDDLSEAVAGTDATKLRLTLMARAAASVRGRVFESDVDNGIPNIHVEAFMEDDKGGVMTTKTDQAGYYRFDGLSAGVYRLVVPGTPAQVFVSDNNTLVRTKWAAQTAGPIFRAAVGEELRGSVINARGAGVAEANVFLSRTDYPDVPRSITTDNDGNFVFTGIHSTEQVTIWGEKTGRTSESFGPVTVGIDGLRGILLRLD